MHMMRLSSLALIIILGGVLPTRVSAAVEALKINCTIHSPYEAFFMEVLSEVCNRLDIPLEHNTPPVGRSLILVNDGIDDGDGPRIAGLEKRFVNLVRVEEPFGEFHFGAFARNETIRLSDWDSLNAYNVAYMRGWKIFDQNLTTHPGPKLIDDSATLFNLLGDDRTEIVLFSRIAGSAIVDGLGLDEIFFVEPPLAIKPSYLYLHKSHTELAHRISETLRQVKEDGTYKRLYGRIVDKDN